MKRLSQCIGLALLTTLATGCKDPQKSSAETPTKLAEVEVDTVKAEDLAREIELSASVVGYESARMMSKIDGYVEAVNVNIGDMVEKGQLLIRLRVPELADEVLRRDSLFLQSQEEAKSRRADVDLAMTRREEKSDLLKLREIQFERAEKLVSEGAWKQGRLDEARYALRAAKAAVTSGEAEILAAKAHYASAIAHTKVTQAELNKAKSEADYRNILAPFDGLVTKRMVDPGTFVRPATGENATSLLHIERVDWVRIVVFLPMEDSPELSKGDQVVINQIEALPGTKIESIGGESLTVSRVSQAFDQGSRMMRAEIDIDNTLLMKETNQQLKSGDYGKITLTVAVYKNQPTIPSSALITRDDKKYVVTLDKSNQCIEVPVRVRIEKENVVGLEIDKLGVQIGQRIVARGADRVKHQQTLKSEQLKPYDPNKKP